MDNMQFQKQLDANGYGEAKSVSYEPDMSNEMHTHPFSAWLLMTEGAMTLVTETGSRVYQPGDSFEVEAGTLHAEQTGASGATFLVGKK